MTINQLIVLLSLLPTEEQELPIFIEVDGDGLVSQWAEVTGILRRTAFENGASEPVKTLILEAAEEE